MHALATELFPIFRGMTGAGVRETLTRLGRILPLAMREVPSGTRVFDWQIPREWEFRDAYIKEPGGPRVVDWRDSNLHVVNHSAPVDARLRWSELKEHLFTLPEHPDWIPYRTTYFQDDWGFCLSHRQFEELGQRGDDQAYDVRIDATFKDGSLTYGELRLPGRVEDEILVSSHVCHPSLANDNLSGIAVATRLAQYVSARENHYSYRFLFAPATLGAIAWLHANQETVDRIKHGLVLALLGDAGASTYKRSRRGNAEIDRAVAHVLEHCGRPHTIMDFEPVGYDERQFCSPGFDLPVGVLMRTPNGQYPEYHTSADDLELIRPEHLADSWARCVETLRVLENNATYRNRNPHGEPQLGRRGAFRGYGRSGEGAVLQQAMLWVLNLSDGSNTLLDVAERSGLRFGRVRQAADRLLELELIE
jgi:aminopeptidase-like protein